MNEIQLPFTKTFFDQATTDPINALLSAPGWATTSNQDRIIQIGESLEGIAVIGDWLLGGFTNWSGLLYGRIANFAGPTIPDKPIGDWIEDWFYETDGWIIVWALDQTNGPG